MKRKRKTFFYFWIIFFGLTVYFSGGFLMAIETTPYRVLLKDGNFELRQYDPYIAAETLVDGEKDNVDNEGFRRLFDYISGNNRKKQAISMTAPVTREKTSEKIAMTSPVTREKTGGKYRITFKMPSAYNLDILPAPLDSRVVLKLEPARLVAAVRYSGTWKEKRFEEFKGKLDTWISRQGLKSLGEPIWARYDPPYKPWFLRRNEVLIPVQRQPDVR
jgi:hypothetical protein